MHKVISVVIKHVQKLSSKNFVYMEIDGPNKGIEKQCTILNGNYEDGPNLEDSISCNELKNLETHPGEYIVLNSTVDQGDPRFYIYEAKTILQIAANTGRNPHTQDDFLDKKGKIYKVMKGSGGKLIIWKTDLVFKIKDDSVRCMLVKWKPAGSDYDLENGYGCEQDNDGMYLGNWENGKRHGQGRLYYGYGKIYYDGEWREGKIHGQGRLYYKDGKIYYDGGLKEGKKHGQGRRYYKNGGVCQGRWKDGKLWKGVRFLKMAGGGKNIKEFKAGKWDDYGVTIYANGEKYKGEFKGGKRDGLGVLTYPNGGKYKGEFKAGKREGYGVSTYPDGREHRGSWKDGKLWNGRGSFKYKNGDKYRGEWKRGKRSGHGVYTYPDGSKYDGEWENDKRHGEGTLRYKDNSEWKGIWKDDNPWNGKGVLRYPNGGECNLALREGKPYTRGDR